MTEDLELFSAKPQSKFSIKEFFYKCLANWPLFIISLFICIAGGVLYLRFAIPQYTASTSIMVKGRPTKPAADLVENALTGTLNPNFDLNNELQLLKSGSLLERVVLKNEFNINYYIIGKIKKSEVYLSAPFRLILQSITDSSSAANIWIEGFDNAGGRMHFGAEANGKEIKFKWNQPFQTAGKTFVLAKKENVAKSDQKYLATWTPVAATSEELSARFVPSLLDKNSSIISMQITTENLKKGCNILDAIAKEYDLADIEERTVITRNTLRFIDDRLGIITNELNGVEGSLESYQGRNQIIDLGVQQAQSFGNANDVSQNLKDINIKQGVVRMIQSYFNNPATAGNLVPSTMGLDDATLSSLISKYNDLQLTKQKEAPFVAANSTVVQDLNNQIDNVRGSILESLQNITRNLKLQEGNYQQQNGQYQQFLSSLPRKERVMQEIKRKQSITEGLYLYLLQKREEAAISSTSASVSNYKQIEPAKSQGQVSPNALNAYLYSILLGLLLPLGWVYLKTMLNNKIISRNDITAVVNLPLVSDINHISEDHKLNKFVIMDRDIIGEQFRTLRTNLSYLLKKKDSQVILVTSSVSGEGKSFISKNIAAVLAIPGKKVALLEFDLRKPAQELNKNGKGLATYLTGGSKELATIYKVSEELPTLHIYSSGAISTNPGDLMLNDNISELFRVLKQQYDYVVVDSAPVGLVSDAFILGDHSDIVLYVIRQRITEKKQLEYLNDIVVNEKFKNMGIIFNDVKTGVKLGYYGYGYGAEYEKYLDKKAG